MSLLSLSTEGSLLQPDAVDDDGDVEAGGRARPVSDAGGRRRRGAVARAAAAGGGEAGAGARVGRERQVHERRRVRADAAVRGQDAARRRAAAALLQPGRRPAPLGQQGRTNVRQAPSQRPQVDRRERRRAAAAAAAPTGLSLIHISEPTRPY